MVKAVKKKFGVKKEIDDKIIKDIRNRFRQKIKLTNQRWNNQRY